MAIFGLLTDEALDHMKYNRDKTKMKDIKRRTYEIIGKMLEINDDEELNAFISEMQTGLYKYIITYDMGCGNTSVAVFHINDFDNSWLINWNYFDQSQDGHFEEVANLSIPTIFGYDDDEPVIGPEAMIYGDAVENFKVIPTEDNLEYIRYAQVGDFTDVPLRRIWRRYFEKTFRMALTDAKNMFDDIEEKNVIFVVAHPADRVWEDCLDTYKNLIAEGTRLKKNQIVTFSEAKASMQYVRVEKAMMLDWKKGVIVIDLGASTIDIEYLAYDQEPLEFSITMAGREVDRLLGNSILSQIYPREMSELAPDELPDEEFFETHFDELRCPKRYFTWRMRLLKEELCCNDGTSGFGYKTKEGDLDAVKVDLKQLESILSTKPLTLNCNDPAIAAFMNRQKGNEKVKLNVRGTWYQHLEQLVTYVLTQIGNAGNYVDKIIVTGGTANLVGIEDHIQIGVKKAGWPEVEIVVFNQPADYERTVPYGSASYIINVIKNIPAILDFPEVLEEALKKDLVPWASGIIRDKVSPVAEKKVREKIKAWADLPKGHSQSSIDALKNTISKISIQGNDLDIAVEQAVKEISGIINQEGFQNTGQNAKSNGLESPKMELRETKKEINAFLDALSMSKKYSHPIAVNGIQCKLDANVISKAVQDSFASLYFGNYIKGFLNNLKYVFTPDDSPLSPNVRQNVLDNFPNVNTISYDLLEPIKKEFTRAFDASDGFGAAEMVMEDLEMDINQAMFIG